MDWRSAIPCVGWVRPFRAKLDRGGFPQGVALVLVWERAFGPAVRTAHGGGGWNRAGAWERPKGVSKPSPGQRPRERRFVQCIRPERAI